MQTTAVKIHNQTYHIRNEDPDRVGRLAAFLDERMREVASQTATVDSLKVAILAALNLADDYFVLREELDSRQESLRARVRGMIDRIDRVAVPVEMPSVDAIE